MVQASHTPPRFGGSLRLFGELVEFTDSICQAKGEQGQAPVPTPTLETNKSNLLFVRFFTSTTRKSILCFWVWVFVDLRKACYSHTFLKVPSTASRECSVYWDSRVETSFLHFCQRRLLAFSQYQFF